MRRALTLAAAALALAPAGAAARTHVLAVEWAPTPVARYGPWTAWSGYDRATREYRLHVAHGTTIFTPGLAPRGVPFDVDLGPGPDGRVWAAFSRCSTEPVVIATVPPGIPIWARGRGCRLRRAPIEAMAAGGAGGEQAIPHTAAAGASEFLPAIWRDRVTFARIYPSRPGLGGLSPYLYTTLRSKPTLRLPGGPRGKTGRPGPMSIDTVRDGEVAFTWAYQVGRQRRWSARLLHIDPEHRITEERMDGAGSWRWLLGASLDSGNMSWVRGCLLGHCAAIDNAMRIVPIHAHTVATRKLAGVVISAARGAGRTAVVSGPGYGVAASDGRPRCRDGADPLFAQRPGCQIELLDG